MNNNENAKVEIVADDSNRCGEGPIWDSNRGRWLWTDIEGARLYQLDPATNQKSVIYDAASVAGIALTAGSDDLIFAGGDGLHRWSAAGGRRTLLTEHDGETLYFNDILADPHGGLYAGTLYWGESGREKFGKLYRIDADGSVQVVDDGIELANGLGLSPDDRTLYFADSAARRIYAYEVDPNTGALSGRRVFVQIPGDEGIPDGLTVDAEGFVWCAQWYGSQVVRYDPDGTVERRLPLPVRQVSSVAFGGPDLSDLFITSAGDAWPSPLAPPGYDFGATNIGGALYQVRPGIVGRVEYRARLGDG